MLEHGGNLLAAAAHYGIPRADWLDLSTGINPRGFPAPALPAGAWQRLPEIDPALALAAQAYYGAPLMLPVAGTQAAIQALPYLRANSRVTLAAPAYAEHAHCWAAAGHAVHQAPYAMLEELLPDSDVVVICNPNNPTGATVDAACLLSWASTLATRGGWLVVDEAFADMTPALSVATATSQAGLIVLRSVGKFFGLAGLRLGFVAAEAALLHALADRLGPWTISGPAQLIGRAALQDSNWQRATRQQLLAEGQRLHELLAHYGITASGSALYQWWPVKDAQKFQMHMAQRAIWVRRFETPPAIRLGLPPDEEGWTRLHHALFEWNTGRPATCAAIDG